ncbi:MAG: hypothetical protein P1V18_05130 [Candidatus Gracilibacteria bacterium]|nr:hypothetical protein [Candidatus Gracilibacteria bacterium]
MKFFRFSIIGLFMCFSISFANAQVDLTDFVPDEEGAATGSFTLDQDGTAGSGDVVQIEFGSVLNEYLQFDVDDGRFELSDDLSLEGNELENFRVENAAADPTCDAPSEGRMYYNTTDDELRVCSNLSWSAVGSEGEGSVDQSNIVYVDSARIVQVGEVYSTLAAAVAYISGETPGPGNRWVILMEPGTNTESVTIPTFTYLVGRDRQSTIFTGTLTLLASSGLQGVSVNGTGEVDIASPLTAHISDADVIIDDGASGGIDGTLVIHDSYVDGFIGASGAVMAYNSLIGPTSLTNNGSIATYHSTVLALTNNGGSLWNNFGTAYSNSVPAAANRLDATNTQSAIDELILGTPADSFILDENQGVAQDVTLEFGNVVGETLAWDETNDYFELSDALIVGGNMNLDGEIPGEVVLRFDADNGSTGENARIIAEQGTDSDGELRYNASTNQWELSNDGGVFAAIATGAGLVTSDLAAVQARRTTDYVLTNAFVDITFDATDVENDAAVVEHDNTNTDQIDIKEDGIYSISYRTQFDITTGTTLVRAFGQVRLNDSTIVPGTESEVDIWYDSAQNLNATVVVSLSDGDFVSLQLSKETTGETATAIDDTVFVVIKLEGVAGATGAQGPAGAGNTLDEAYDEGGAGVGRQIVVDSGAFDLQGTGEMIELGDGSASDLQITFDDGTDRSFGWDDSLSSFFLSESVDIYGSTITLDADEAGNPDRDLEIVAEQGSESNGTLRYDDGNNRWEMSNDGGTFSALQSVSVAQVYESGTTTFDALTPIDWDGTNTTARIVDPLYSHSTVSNPSRVTVTQSGLYEVSYSIAWDTTANARRTASCEFRVNGAAVPTGVGDSHDYARNNTDDFGSNSSTFLYIFAASDYYEISCTSTGSSGSITTLAGQSYNTIRLLRPN